MKLKTSQILTQLSEQERHQAEIKLAELQARKAKLKQQHLASIERIKQLNHQRDQALRTRNSASLLEVFDISVREQQMNIHSIHQHCELLEAEKQALLQSWMQANKKHHAYHSVYKKEHRQQRRQHDLQSQRQLDDLVAARISLTSA